VTATKLIIIGAPRSGTNMLRDVLTALPGMATWPCDEINYIWRHGNVRYPSDELPPEAASPGVQGYVRRKFAWVADRYRADVVVEKTCANSLRVDFVGRVVPDAKYVFIRRDGIDAVGSALERWKAGMDWAYVLRKARFIPLTDFPYYGARYLWNRLYRLVSRERRLAFWGPKLQGMEELLGQHSLEEVCALQWQRCVENAAAAFEKMPGERYLEIKYEDFVQSPEDELNRILGFIGRSADSDEIPRAVANVSPRSLGRGRQALGEDVTRRLDSLVGTTLRRYGYAGA